MMSKFMKIGGSGSFRCLGCETEFTLNLVGSWTTEDGDLTDVFGPGKPVLHCPFCGTRLPTEFVPNPSPPTPLCKPDEDDEK
jgi:uncharacterized Zn-finger protein